MAGWLPVLKASLPYVSQIVTAALPAFTAKPPGARPEDVVPRQIAELQEAVTANAERVKELAIQLKEVLESMDAGVAESQAEIARLRQPSMRSAASRWWRWWWRWWWRSGRCSPAEVASSRARRPPGSGDR